MRSQPWHAVRVIEKAALRQRMLLVRDMVGDHLLRSVQLWAKVAELEPGNGLNAETGVYGDLIKAGIIDPVKVTRSALRNAASIASMILTTNTLVVEKKVQEEPAEGGHGHGHGH